MQQLKHDTYFLFFLAGALLALFVSAPATYAIVSPFHSNGSRLGVVLAVAFVMLLEAGAVGAKIAGLNKLCIALLVGTVFANYAAGNDYFSQAALPPTLSSWRSAGFGWIMVLLYAASVPVLLYTFLHVAITRARVVLVYGQGGDPMVLAISALRTEVRALADSNMLTSLPRQADHPAPVPVEPASSLPAVTPKKTYACKRCGAAFDAPTTLGTHTRYHCAAVPARQNGQPASKK